MAAIVTSGIWTTPALDAVWLIAFDITRDPFPTSSDADWLLTSWLTPALAWLVGATGTPHTFALFCGGLLIGCYAFLCLMFRLQFGEPAARILVLVFASSPLATVLLTWIGYGDPLTIALTTAILTLPPLWLKAICAAFLVSNHAEQAAVLLTLCLLVIPCLDNRYAGQAGWKLAVALVAGALAGWGAVHVFQVAQGIPVERSRLQYMLENGIDRHFTQLVRNPQMLFWSFFGVSWLLVIPAALSIRRRSDEMTAPVPRLAGAALICIGMTAATLDSTRVFGLLSWPVLVTLLVVSVRRGAAPSLIRLATAAFLLSLILPRTVVWDGQINGGTAAYNLAWALKTSGAAPGILPESRLAPFREAPEHWIRISALLPDHGATPLIASGDSLSFTHGGEGGPALRTGWSPPEPWGTWSEGPAASLRLKLSADLRAVGALEAQVAAFLGSSSKPQVIEVKVDGASVGTWTFTDAEPSWRRIPLPSNIVRNNGTVTISFHIPTARSPASEGISADARLLGLRLITIRTAGEHLAP